MFVLPVLLVEMIHHLVIVLFKAMMIILTILPVLIVKFNVILVLVLLLIVNNVLVIESILINVDVHHIP